MGRNKVWSGLVGTSQTPSRYKQGITLTMGPHWEFKLLMDLLGWVSLQLTHPRGDVSDKERR